MDSFPDDECIEGGDILSNTNENIVISLDDNLNEKETVFPNLQENCSNNGKFFFVFLNSFLETYL